MFFTFRSVLRYLITLILGIFLPWTASVHAAPGLPQSDLCWKNMPLDGKNITVFTIFIDSHGRAWIGSNSGLYLYDGVSARAVMGEKLTGYQIYSIEECGESLYLGSNNGLLRYDIPDGSVDLACPESPKEIRDLLLNDSVIWIGSLEGIFRYEIREGKIENLSEGLPHRSVYSLLRDSRGVVYAGTYNGLSRWNSSKSEFQKVPSGPKGIGRRNIFVNCMLEASDNSSIYIGTEGALYLYDPTSETWIKIDGLDGNNIKSLASNSDGHLLVGTNDGVYYIHPSTPGEAIRHFRHDSRLDQTISDNEIWHISSDNSENIWIGHEKGFSIASNSSAFRTIKLASLANSGEGNDFHVIFRDSRDDLWFGGTNGILRLSTSLPVKWYRHTDSPRSLSHNRIRAVTESGDGQIWFGTDAGINRYNPETDDFDIFNIVDSLGGHTSNWIYSVMDEGDSILVGSYIGGIHLIEKERFAGNGGTIDSPVSLNSDFSNLRGGKFRLDNDLVNKIVCDRDDNLWILLYRDRKLTRISKAGEVISYDILDMSGEYPTNLATDSRGRVWCAFNGGLLAFLEDGTTMKADIQSTDNDNSILAMGRVGDDMWVSTYGSIWKVDGHTLKPSLLPIPQKPYSSIYEDPSSHRVYLGSTDEITEVDPAQLEADSGANRISVLFNSSSDRPFGLDTLSGQTPITIPYEGILTIVVSNFDYSPESVQRYIYKLVKGTEDNSDDWVILPEGVNTIQLSDISMGSYTLLVKILGDLSEPLAIPLRVKGHWMLSWWAFIIYLLIILIVIVAIVFFMHLHSKRKIQDEDRKKTIESVEKKLIFLSNISHDFKTPLSMILGPASMLKERTKDLEDKKNLEVIYQNAVRLNNLIHRTIELNHLDEGAENMVILSCFDAVSFCKNIFDTFKENHTDKKFVFHASVDRVVIEADAIKFESIITNLISNSCKYSEDGATISVGIHAHDQFMEIVVSDDGMGISPDDQQLVFQRMYRGKSTASVSEGTGLGLYLIKKYLDLMHGNIELYSKKDQGTSFVVTLPINESGANSEEENTETSSDTKKPRILIVEDNIQISAFIRNLLKADFTCCIAENGKAGLALASSFTPDLIILDEMMPIMTGIEMAKLLKQNPRLATVPIIMLTARDDNNTENESIKLGIDVFMSKPFEPTVLISRINHLIRSRSTLRQSVRLEKLIEPQPIEAESMTEKQLAKIVKLIEENVADPELNVNQLCEKSGIPNKQLYRLVKKYMGIGPLDYIRRVRLQKAAMLLSQHRFTVSEVSYMVGFKTPSYFAKCFQQQYGVTPSQYHSPDTPPSGHNDNEIPEA